MHFHLEVQAQDDLPDEAPCHALSPPDHALSPPDHALSPPDHALSPTVHALSTPAPTTGPLFFFRLKLHYCHLCFSPV